MVKEFCLSDGFENAKSAPLTHKSHVRETSTFGNPQHFVGFNSIVHHCPNKRFDLRRCKWACKEETSHGKDNG